LITDAMILEDMGSPPPPVRNVYGPENRWAYWEVLEQVMRDNPSKYPAMDWLCAESPGTLLGTWHKEYFFSQRYQQEALREIYGDSGGK
jgi:hypothetical protein